MGMMAKMRTLAPAFILTVGGLFVLFMVISDSNVLEALGGRSQNVGSVNGRHITYQEFNSFVERARENQKAQTGQDIDEENIDSFRDQVWDAVVAQIITEQKLEEYGITVSDQEILDVVRGENPPDFLKRSFIDSTGRFNREMYDQAIFDPRNKEALIQAEEVVKQQLLSEKLQSVVTASLVVPESEIRRKFAEQNIKMTAEYVLVDISQFPDSAFKPSEDEMKKYYTNNPDRFKVEAQRKLKYVLFPIAASKRDSSQVLDRLNEVLAKASKDTSFKYYVDGYSETPYSRDTLEISALPENAVSPLMNAQPNTLVGPVATPTGYNLYKLIVKVGGTNEFVRAQHILISSTGDDAKDLAEANRIYALAAGGADFGALAKQHSKDPGSAAKGGDLGWYGKGRMVKEFEDASFKGPVNVVQKPVKTSYGYHIIKVLGKTSSRFVVEKVTMSIKPSATTRDDIYASASDFAYLAEKNGFEKEAEIAKYKVEETTPFNKDAFFIPGIGNNKGAVNFAFENGVNTISPVFRITNGFVVFKISEVIKAGVKKYDDVKKEVESFVIREKKLEKSKAIVERLKGKLGNDLAKVTSLEGRAIFNTAAGFAVGGTVPTVGTDYNFSARAYDAELNKVIGPVKGNRGYFLIKVTQRTPFDEASYKLQRNSIRDNILNEKKSYYFNQWLTQVREKADIVDRRYIFFGR